jgi:hypothetical protein
MSHVQRLIPKRAMFDADYGPHLHRIGDPRNEDMTPCPVCDGDGYRMVLSDDNKPCREVCPACEGARWLDETGYPYTQQESDE